MEADFADAIAEHLARRGGSDDLLRIAVTSRTIAAAVFGAMADKDLAPMLAKVGPVIDRWYFTDLPSPRAATGAALLAQWQAQNTRKDTLGTVYASPQQALDAAVAAAGPTDRIVVFGSFYTVGGVLAQGIPRLQAQHLQN